MQEPDPVLDRAFHQLQELRHQFLHAWRVEMGIERFPADPALVEDEGAGLPVHLVRFVIDAACIVAGRRNRAGEERLHLGFASPLLVIEPRTLYVG